VAERLRGGLQIRIAWFNSGVASNRHQVDMDCLMFCFRRRRELYVINAGEPIPAEAFDRLFEPFTREDNRPSQQGLGLGLFIASEISKAHDGELSAKSTSAETRFTFRMPISLAARSG
jgi:signal transduction histidine kinase